MIQKIKDAKIVITHGGPSSFIIPLQYGKTPIVIPRMRKYGEHVNDHQVDFCKKYSSVFPGRIILEEELNKLYNDIITNLDKHYVKNVEKIDNNIVFSRKFNDLITREIL